MATLFSSGFETGDFSEFHTVSTGASIVTSPVKEGAYAAAVSGGSSGFRMGGTWDRREVWANFWVRIDREIATSQYVSSIANVEDLSGYDLAYLRARHHTDGRIGLYFRNVAGALAQDVAGEHFVEPGVWYRFGLRLRVGAGTGLLELQIDGASALLHENRDLAEASIGLLMLYNSSTGSPRTSYFDGIAVDDAGWPDIPAPPTGLSAVIL